MKLLASIDIGTETKLGNNGPSISSGFQDFGSLFSLLLNNAITIAGVIFLTLLIIAGVNYIIGAGDNDAKKIKQATDSITWAIIGLVVVMCSYFIIQIVEVVTGLSIIKPGI